MKFAVAFVATLACAFASPSSHSAYSPAGYHGYGSHALAPVTVLSSGFLADTPEVAHAKATHLAEKAKVSSYGYAAPAPYAYGDYGYASYAGAYAHSVADIKVLPNGYLADTPEVAHVKAAHKVAKGYVAAAAAANPDYDSYSHGYQHAAPTMYAAPYTHSVAHIKVLPNGFLADTPEVAHAKAVHSAEKAKAYAAAAASPNHGSYTYAAPVYSYAAPSYSHSSSAYTYAAPYAAGYYGHSVADIKVLPNGFLADTPEVAHAKAAHSAEKAKAYAASPYQQTYTYADSAYSYVVPTYSHASPKYYTSHH